MTFLSVTASRDGILGSGLWWQVRSVLSLPFRVYDLSVRRMEGYEPAEEQRDLDINGRRKKQRSCAECRQVVIIWFFFRGSRARITMV